MKVLVKVTPNSRVEGITSDDTRLLVKVKEPPREGKANRAVVRLLAEYYKVSPNSVRIIRGFGSRNKVIEIEGLS